MTFLVAVALEVAAGLALLRLLRLGTGSRAADVPLAWLVGTGWLSAVAAVARFALGIPFGRATVLALLLAPVAVHAALRWRARRSAAAAPAVAPPTDGDEASVGSARWLPRPLWLFAPLAAYVVVVLAVVVLHGTNTPTQTDDGVRVRAFAPMLATANAWPTEARPVFSMAGALPTFVPAVGWVLSGEIDHFHVNYTVLAELVALLALAVTLGAARGCPERGWAGAFGVLSIPLFVYHCTATYSDAVLAMRVAAGVLFAIEYARTRAHADAGRALLLLGIAALVKREGELVAAAPAAMLVAQLAWERWREARPFPWRVVALAAVVPVLGAIGKIAAFGLAAAFPMAGLVVQKAGVVAAGAGARASAAPAQTVASLFFGLSLFREGNQGMLFWIAVAAILVRARELPRGQRAWPLLGVAALFGEVAVSSVVLFPEFTVNQGTVHRALLVVSVPLALWTAGTIVEAARAETLAPSAAPVKGAPGGEGAGTAEVATQPGRRRPRRGRRP
jgi:hypothetical protein